MTCGKVAFCTGITGQDGSYLAEFLLNHGYEVHGLIRRSSTDNTKNIDHIKKHLHLHYGDITDLGCIHEIITSIRLDEIYNLAGQSHVGYSFICPQQTIQVNTIGLLNILETVTKYSSDTRVFQASTSEMFDGNSSSKYTETSPFNPKSPYGISKLQSHNLIDLYRSCYGIFCCSGISFNHESPRRSGDFVTKKIVKWFCGNFYNGAIYKEQLQLGNIGAIRDWGHSKDFVRAFVLMLNNRLPKDFIITTEDSYSVKEVIETCFNFIGKEIVWDIRDFEVVGIVDENEVIISSVNNFRPCEVNKLCGSSKSIRSELKWNPEYTFKDTLKEMIDNE